MGSDCRSVQFCAYLNTFMQLLPIGVSTLNELLGTSIIWDALSVVGVDNLAGLYKLNMVVMVQTFLIFHSICSPD